MRELAPNYTGDVFRSRHIDELLIFREIRDESSGITLLLKGFSFIYIISPLKHLKFVKMLLLLLVIRLKVFHERDGCFPTLPTLFFCLTDNQPTDEFVDSMSVFSLCTFLWRQLVL